MAEKDERTGPERGLQQGVVRRLERTGARHGVSYHPAQLRDPGIGTGGGLLDELVEGDARIGGGVLKGRELPAGFVEVAAEALQVLLHELRPLGKQDRAQYAQDAIDEAVEYFQESPAGFHEPKVKPFPGKASGARANFPRGQK